MFKLSVSVILGVMASLAQGGTHSKAPEVGVDSSRAMVIEGVIQGNNLSKVKEAMLSKEDNGTVDLIINSPGGSIVTGFEFVSVMESAKARGVTINCFVPHVAASMAFQILLHCDHRYVLDRSFLLWHRARVMMGGMFGAPMTAPQLAVISKDLQAADSVILNECRKYLQLDEKTISYHFENETLHIGENLGQMSKAFVSLPSIEGLFEALTDSKVPRSEQQNPLFGRVGRVDLSQFKFGELIYITTKGIEK